MRGLQYRGTGIECHGMVWCGVVWVVRQGWREEGVLT